MAPQSVDAHALDLSRSELRALLLRAARGAGLPLGHAEDWSRAVSMFGDEAALTALADALEAGWPGPCDPTSAESAKALSALPPAVDALGAGAGRVVMRGVDYPALLAPYLDMERLGRGIHAVATVDGPDTHLTLGAPQPAVSRPQRMLMPQQLYDRLNTLAHRTYVPATAASRAGAGAGANDTD
ncbi:MAG: DUF3726 domain-containing protein [Pseudomonadota bacterium]